jgi:hypothetical protein
LSTPADQPRPPLKLAEPPPTPPPQDPDATPLDRLLNVGLLAVYGLRGEMTRRVRSEVAFAGMLILIQGCVDLLAWYLGLRLVFVSGFGPLLGEPLAFTFALLFSATIAIFERSVLTADVDMRGMLRSPATYFRMLFVLLACTVTAVPLELFLFRDDIDGVINGERAARVERAQGILKADVDARLAALDAQLDRDLKRTEEQYAPLRTYVPPQVTSVSPRLDALMAQLTAVTGLMQQEDEGRRSGRGGRGPRWRSLKGQQEELEAQRVRVYAEHLAELVELRKEAAARASAGEATYKDAVATLRATVDKDRAALAAERVAIEELPPDTLARRARVSTAVPEGFSARVRVLSSLADREEVVNLGIWALRFVMILFGLLVLIQKATFSTETRAYFSAMARAAAGDGRLRQLFGGLLVLPEWNERQRRSMRAVSQVPPPRQDGDGA